MSVSEAPTDDRKELQLSQTSPTWSVSRQAAPGERCCCSELLSCRTFIVWLGFRWEITTSDDRIKRGRGLGFGGGVRGWLSERDPGPDRSRKTSHCVDGELDFGGFSFESLQTLNCRLLLVFMDYGLKLVWFLD